MLLPTFKKKQDSACMNYLATQYAKFAWSGFVDVLLDTLHRQAGIKPQSQELVTNIFRKGRRISVKYMKVNIGLFFPIVRVCDKLLWLSLEEMHIFITLYDN